MSSLIQTSTSTSTMQVCTTTKVDVDTSDGKMVSDLQPNGLLSICEMIPVSHSQEYSTVVQLPSKKQHDGNSNPLQLAPKL